MGLLANRRTVAIIALIVVFAGVVSLFSHALSPLAAERNVTIVFDVQPGEGFRTIISALSSAHLIRSSFAVELFSLLGGKAFNIKPGLYRLSAGMSSEEIINILAAGNAVPVTITIPEGSNKYDIDRILSNALVIRPGALIHNEIVEGKLFPDTYQFYTNTSVQDVVAKLMDNFNTKAVPILDQDKKNFDRNLILASLVEKEVPDPADQAIVAGILLKRANTGMTLNVDAAVCYAKFLAQDSAEGGCYPLTPLDFKIASPYNTYLNKGLPPGPIGNPGASAIAAVLHPQSSPYWYYLSDPKTGKTVYARTLAEQNINREKYFGR